MKKISAEAVSFVETSNVSKDNELEVNRVETFTAAVLRIKSKTFGKKFTNEGSLEISAVVEAEVDTANIDKLFSELSAAHNSNRSYEKVLEDYTKQQKQFDTVYGEYLGSYQKRIMRTIRDGCKLQLDGKFDEALKLYDAAIIEATANDAELSLAYIKRGNVYKTQGKNNLAAADFQKALALNNDAVGVHFVKAVMAEASGDKVQAAQEYRAFVKDADIVYYDAEIIFALDRIVALEEAN